MLMSWTCDPEASLRSHVCFSLCLFLYIIMIGKTLTTILNVMFPLMQFKQTVLQVKLDYYMHLLGNIYVLSLEMFHKTQKSSCWLLWFIYWMRVTWQREMHCHGDRSASGCGLHSNRLSYTRDLHVYKWDERTLLAGLPIDVPSALLK